MEYREKIQMAEIVAEALENNKTIDQIEIDLKEKGLFKSDIDQVIRSARNIIGERLQPLIRANLLADQAIIGAKEFENIDKSTLEKFIERELRALEYLEKRKVNELLKKDLPPEEIFNQTDLRFYSKEKLIEQMDTFGDIQRENSNSFRFIKIFGGILLIVIGISVAIITYNNGNRLRIMYGIIIVGFGLLSSGILKKDNPYD